MNPIFSVTMCLQFLGICFDSVRVMALYYMNGHVSYLSATDPFFHLTVIHSCVGIVFTSVLCSGRCHFFQARPLVALNLRQFKLKMFLPLYTYAMSRSDQGATIDLNLMTLNIKYLVFECCLCWISRTRRWNKVTLGKDIPLGIQLRKHHGQALV